MRMKTLLLLLSCSFWATHVHAQDETEWRAVDPERLVVMTLDAGVVFLELNSTFAPATVTQFKRLVREGFYDGLSFYRVIEGFVAQGGDGSDMGNANSEPTIKGEFERKLTASLPFTSVQKPDMFAAETGFSDGFAAARDPREGTAWLTHCPGTLAMARLNEADTSSTDFYIVIGQAPRYLDRNMNIFGRVVLGMDIVQRIRRGAASEGGMLSETDTRTAITSVRIAADIAPSERPAVEVMDTDSAAFAAMLESRRHRVHEFFQHTPAPVLDVCQVPNAGRLLSAN
ncbi:peptidylprolyl isomerase [Woeseia oceani]|uniref:peptidylprolyl isomerase n=1 Tax=Woeseia oceani TaxID=1548547 RepID=A0A193LG71_9GAMM|nr:peptidylprolyl isomerase [Woeseia oceani]ANO51364.1 hypothetical protein BA177_09270 [Woeseia oceani]